MTEEVSFPNFSLIVEEMLLDNPDYSILECIVEAATEHSIDIEDVPKLLSKTLKDKIEVEAIQGNMLKHRGDDFSILEVI
jgi:hypothetical protein